MLQSHYFNSSMDGNEEGLKKLCSILTLLAPSKNYGKCYFTFFYHFFISFSCLFPHNFLFAAECNAALNASENADVERMLGQPEEKRSILERKKTFHQGSTRDP